MPNSKTNHQPTGQRAAAPPHHSASTSRQTKPPAIEPAARRSQGQPLAAVPRLLTVDEVAEILRTTRRAVYALIRRGTLPGVVRLSRRILIDRAELVRWIDDRRASPTRGASDR